MGANTFSIELGEPIRLPLRLPDEPAGVRVDCIFLLVRFQAILERQISLVVS